MGECECGVLPRSHNWERYHARLICSDLWDDSVGKGRTGWKVVAHGGTAAREVLKGT